MNERKKTVLYVRQSLDTDKQPHSTIMQMDREKELAKMNNWIIHEVYNEGIRSARKTEIPERPELFRLLNDVEAGRIERILVFKRDRLARNVQQYVEIYRSLKKHKVEVCFTADNEPHIFDGAVGEFIEAILAGIAEHEADNIVRRLISSKIDRANKGFWVGGSIPYAYKKRDWAEGDEGKNLEIDETKKEIVRALYKEFISLPDEIMQTRSYTLVCKTLKKNDLLKDLSNSQIYSILVQCLHIGEMEQWLDGVPYKYTDDWIQENLRILQDDEIYIWDKAKTLLKGLDIKRSYIKAHKEQSDEKVWAPKLENILYCGICKNPMLTSKKMYKCKNCKKQVGIEAVDRMVFNHLLNALIKYGYEHWERVRVLLEAKFVKEFDLLADKSRKKMIRLEKEIKAFFQVHLSSQTEASKKQLTSLIKKYRDESKMCERAEVRYFHVQTFIELLKKDKS